MEWMKEPNHPIWAILLAVCLAALIVLLVFLSTPSSS